MSDAVNHPQHYNAHESGVEAIEVCEHLNFCLGNAVKYVWRAGQKGDRVEDLRKARWYLTRELAHQYPVGVAFEGRFFLATAVDKVCAAAPTSVVARFLTCLRRGDSNAAFALLDEEIGGVE